ncbi:MAG: hypothetical protein LBV12_09980 [Puniceicoccales bacterium]|jgi:hypothetical protein|nr:hypothetical protein [Puniceicoccales bacterium]
MKSKKRLFLILSMGSCLILVGAAFSFFMDRNRIIRFLVGENRGPHYRYTPNHTPMDEHEYWGDMNISDAICNG